MRTVGHRKPPPNIYRACAEPSNDQTERERLVHSTPPSYIEGRGYRIRLADIPEPYRTEFATASLGSTVEKDGGDPMHFLHDWMKWLDMRFPPGA